MSLGKAIVEMSSLGVKYSRTAEAAVANIAALLKRQVEKRCPVSVVSDGNADYTVRFELMPDIGAEGFKISDDGGNGIRISGGDVRGLLYGAGKFLHTTKFTDTGMTPGGWRGRSAPAKPVRGIYFATHFHNWYQDAPVEEVCEYIGELGLWGYNALCVWYDMHHFHHGSDPAATAFRKRLYAMFAAAKALHMDVNIILVGNEGYMDAPSSIRADISKATRGGRYDTQICVSVPEGEKYVLDNFAEYFEDMKKHDVAPSGIWLWPYDQGGCACPKCAPSGKTWGEAGFLKISELLCGLAKSYFPELKAALSLWLFQPSETGAVVRLSNEKNAWFDQLVVDDARTLSGTPGVPVFNFPEISMREMFPWAGFGATVLAGYCQDDWNSSKQFLQGGFPYSEGIYEDINKVIYSRLYWGGVSAAEALAEYMAFEFDPAFASELVKVAETLERNHHFRWWPEMLKGKTLLLDWFPCRGVEAQADPGAEEACETVKKIDAELSRRAATSWRWRQFYLRTLLDAELKKNGGAPNEICEMAFAELIKIYHAQNADTHVRPPKAESV